MSDKFENNLWAELEREHAPVLLQTLATQRRRITTRWLGAAAGVAVLAGAGVIALTYFGGTPPAYAVVDNPDGSVTMTIREAERFEEATSKLRERGITAVAVPLRKDCPASEATKIEHPAMGDTGPVEVFYPVATKTFEARIFSDRIPVGVTLVLSVQETPEGGFSLATGYSRGELPKCVLEPEPQKPVTSIPQPTPTY